MIVVVKYGLQLKGTNREFQFKEGVTEVLISFAERDLELYKNVIQYYLTNGDPFALDSPVLVDRLFKVLDTTGVLAILRLPISNANAVVRFALLLGPLDSSKSTIFNSTQVVVCILPNDPS